MFLIGYGANALYQHGYDKGVATTTELVSKEKAKWTVLVDSIQKDHDQRVKEIELKYQYDVDRLNQQIASLNANPKVIEKYIPTYVEIPPTFVLLHDRCASGKRLDIMIDDSELTSTTYTLSDIGNTFAYNYTICNQAIAKLTALQQIVRQYIEKQQELIGENNQ